MHASSVDFSKCSLFLVILTNSKFIKGLTDYLGDKIEFDVSSEDPSSGISQ